MDSKNVDAQRKEYELSLRIENFPTEKEIEFVHRLVELIESYEAICGGGFRPVDEVEEDNNEEKG
jgi:hypothetical protein